jgi:hypothetical protein
MFEAQLLIAKSDETYSVYSPWFPKGGDNAEFAIDMIEIENPVPVDFKVEVLTKNTEDTGNGTAIATPSAITTTTGITKFGLDAESTIKELVRYRYTVYTQDPATLPMAWWLFRMLAPVWYDKV